MLRSRVVVPRGAAPLRPSDGVDAYGRIIDVDDRSTPDDCSHILRTPMEPARHNPEAQPGMCDEHASVAADDCVVLNENRNPILAPVYLYMMLWKTSP